MSEKERLSPWFVGAVIVNDMLTILTFVWWGVAGQMPMNFALTAGSLLAIPLVLIWTSPSPILVGVSCFVGMIVGLFIGDALLGIPVDGPVPVRPNLMFHRMFGPLVGCAFAGSAALVVTILTKRIEGPEAEMNESLRF